MTDNFVLNFDNRSDGGPRFVGPFHSRQDAEDHADSLAGPGWQASFCVVRLTAPERDQGRLDWSAGPPISMWSPAPGESCYG